MPVTNGRGDGVRARPGYPVSAADAGSPYLWPRPPLQPPADGAYRNGGLMLHRLSTGFGWVSAEVSGDGEEWVATLAGSHPSLSRVAPGVGRSEVEALANLALAISALSTREC